MKKYISYLYIIATLLVMSCSDVQYQSQGVNPAGLTNLNVENKSGDIALNWGLPEGASEVTIKYDSEPQLTIQKETMTHTFLNATVNQDHLITVKVRYPDGRISEGVTKRITIEGSNPVANLKAVRINNAIEVSWDLPTSNTSTNIEIQWNTNTPVAIDGQQTKYTILDASAAQSYKIGVRTKNTLLKSHYVTTEVKSLKIAYLMGVEFPTDIVDDDEKASYKWFTETYAEGETLTPNSILSADLTAYSVIWLHIDRDGILPGANNLPKNLIDGQVVSKLAAYLKQGGNLLLTNHATQYLTLLDRLPANRIPGIFGSGAGGAGTDTWAFNTNIGEIYSHANHAMFNAINTFGDYGHPTIPLIGPGHREDHNCMWDLNSYTYSIPGDNVVDKFEKENQAIVLATWAQVTDFCCAGIVEFQPAQAIKGRCIAIGLASYEWNQNSNVNIYQHNIELLTKNTITYLQNN